MVDPAADGLEQVLDDHADLRDVLAQLGEAGDGMVLRGLLERLRDLLGAHFAREEADPELLARLAVGSRPEAGPGDAAGSIVAEHRALLAALDSLIRQIEAAGGDAGVASRREVARFLEQLAAHDARETRSLGGRVAPRSAAGGRADSRALEVNLRRTAVEVVIPPEHAVLLDIVAPRRGVHQATRKLLLELHHRYVGWEQALEDLHRRAMGDLSYYLEDPRAPAAIGVFFSLYARVVERAAPPLQEAAVRRWLYYFEKLATEAASELPRLAPALERGLARLGDLLGRSAALAAAASPRLRGFAEKLVAGSSDAAAVSALGPALDLLARALGQVYAHWLEEPDPWSWWRELAGAGVEPPPSGPLRAIGHGRMRECAAELERIIALDTPERRAAALLALPDEAEIQRAHLDAVEAVAVAAEAGAEGRGQLARIHWLIRVLSREALRDVHIRAVSEIHRALRGALAGAEPATAAALVREIFAGLHESQLGRSEVALALIEKLGVEVLGAGEPEAVRALLDQLLDWDFPAPAFAGFTDEWKPRVDPAHLRALRSFLAIVRSAPKRARPLIAMLVVHLERGGVFVADTDLFQRDVSALLGAGIEPVYHPLKQLLRLLPIYFEDVGAEGELRDVSSRIDEVGARKDPLCHFLRKQCHVESNPRLLELVDAVGAFWDTGEPRGLAHYLPPALYERCAGPQGLDPELHRVFSALASGASVGELALLDREELRLRLAGVEPPESPVAEKSLLLVRLRLLLGRKYEFGHDDLLERLAASRHFGAEGIAALRDALERHDDERALGMLIAMLEELDRAILSPESSEAEESIYRKRHIAAGIPSLYGRYREPKLEALGLSFRIESLAAALFERLLDGEGRECVTRDALERTRRWLLLLLRAVRVDGCRARGLAAGIAMLEEALSEADASLEQYVDIFQILERGVERLVRVRFLDVYHEVLERTVRRELAASGGGVQAEGEVLKASDELVRDLIARSFGLQAIDRLVASTLRRLSRALDEHDPATRRLLVGFDAERCCAPIDGEAESGPLDGVVRLGNKGYQIRRLALDGLPVPPGFVLTTGVCRAWPAIRRCGELRGALRERIRARVRRLERATGLRFGDPRRPLLLSVRSGAAVSMPGMLDTFLDVGIDDAIAQGLATHRSSPWGAWDAYRRFLQFWGMAHGIERDRFDALMRELKAELGMDKKAQIPPASMRKCALRYRRLVEEQGVEVVDDPSAQLERCIELVIRSWDSEKARAYRAEMHIAEEWGTAVVIQAMVYGNLHGRSGTGVALTCDPRRPSDEVLLYGDFVPQSQGDDVVAGLVETWPIGAVQGRSAADVGERSLEREFPAIHRALLEHARFLVHERGLPHQELEFTFESDQPEDLYILQTRDCATMDSRVVSAFVPGTELERAYLATGIGAGGGALSGRLAHTVEDVRRLRRSHPEDPIILARRDTVPDDVPLILQTDGLLTALGGATSHAALVAQQLGRACVVGCRALEVDEERGCSRIGDRVLPTGCVVSICGIDGSVYLGNHPRSEGRRQPLG